MHLRTLALPALVLLTGAAAAPLWTAADYETLQPAPAEIRATLDAQAQSLSAAVMAAEKSAGGKAASASLSGDVYEVDVYTTTERHRVLVSGADGSITSSEVVPRFPGEPVSGDWIESPSGLKYFDLKVGDGPEPASNETTVSVHYTGYLNDGTIFDSSHKRNQPADFPLNRVIKGWTEGVRTMKVGGIRKLVIPYELAYGAGGRGSAIPPKATLIFDIELLRIVK